MLLFVLLVLAVYSVAFGSVWYAKIGYAGWAPTALVVLALAASWGTGRLQ